MKPEITKTEVIDLIKDDEYLSDLIPEIENTDHQIEKVEGILRWKPDPALNPEGLNLNDVCEYFVRKGITKNDEKWRDYYRRLGYSLFGYWEVFYWDLNNEEADQYDPKTAKI